MTTLEIFKAIHNGNKVYTYGNGDKAIFVNNEKVLIENKNVVRLAEYIGCTSIIRFDENTGNVKFTISGWYDATEEENSTILSIYNEYFEKYINDDKPYNFRDELGEALDSICRQARARIIKFKGDELARKNEEARKKYEAIEAERAAKKAAKEAEKAQKAAEREAKKLAKNK